MSMWPSVTVPLCLPSPFSCLPYKVLHSILRLQLMLYQRHIIFVSCHMLYNSAVNVLQCFRTVLQFCFCFFSIFLVIFHQLNFTDAVWHTDMWACDSGDGDDSMNLTWVQCKMSALRPSPWSVCAPELIQSLRRCWLYFGVLVVSRRAAASGCKCSMCSALWSDKGEGGGGCCCHTLPPLHCHFLWQRMRGWKKERVKR